MIKFGTRRRIISVAMAVGLLSLAGTFGQIQFASQGHAQENRNEVNLLLLPTSRQARMTLQQSCKLWTQKSLRATAADIERQYGISIWIDRRVDPTQTVELFQADSDATLESELARIAKTCGVAGGLVGNVYLIAPVDRLARVQRSAVVLHGQLSKADKKVAQACQELEWSDISSGQELLEAIRQRWNVQMDAELPHDLFHAGKLSKSALATQLALLLGGFDLQATVTSRAGDSPPIKLHIKPLTEEFAWEDNYAKTISAQSLGLIVDHYPTSRARHLANQRVAVNGETNLHNDVLSFGLRSKKRDIGNARATREPLYSFNMETKLPVELLLDNLSKNFQFEIVWSSQCTPAVRNRLVQLQVKDMTRKELLKTIGAEAELIIDDQGNRIAVTCN